MKELTLKLEITDEQFDLLLNLLRYARSVQTDPPFTPLHLDGKVKACLARVDIHSEADLLSWANSIKQRNGDIETNLLHMRNMGPTSVKELKREYPEIFN